MRTLTEQLTEIRERIAYNDTKISEFKNEVRRIASKIVGNTATDSDLSRLLYVGGRWQFLRDDNNTHAIPRRDVLELALMPDMVVSKGVKSFAA